MVQGDNLLALKALLPHYAGQVKCIYIDPPYNTGNEGWVYNDNVNSDDIRKWLGKVVGKEVEDLSRHDKWLCMMYPRLKLLKEFLRDDGVIFVSIDDSAMPYLRLLMDDIYEKNNFITQFIWSTDGHTDNQFPIKINHEYIACYAKKADNTSFGYVIDPNTREESNLWAGYAENSITKNGSKNPASEIELPIGFPVAKKELHLPRTNIPNGLIEAMADGLSSNPLKKKFPGIQFPLRLSDMAAKDGKLIKPCKVYSGWANANKLRDFINNGCVPIKDAEGDRVSFFVSSGGVIYYRKEREAARNILSVLRNFSTTEKMRSELETMGIKFPYPKPKQLIEHLIAIGSGQNDLILDSFAGSGTTGHAVLQANAEDGGNRRFILVEMDKTIAQEVTAQRLTKVIGGYFKNGDTDKPVAGLDGGFRFCRLGKPLFDEWGELMGEATFSDIAAHVFFIETGSPIPKKANDDTPFIGAFNGKAVYLLYSAENTGLPLTDAGNILTPELLPQLALPQECEASSERVVYAEHCTLDHKQLEQENIRFRQIPYHLTKEGK